MSDPDLAEILDFCVALARKAGDIILQASDALLTSGATITEEKSSSVDIVTEYDVKVEELMFSEMKKQYPAFKFIGEESYAADSRPALTSKPTFCVDPIDGTTNFVHGFPFVCTSIGLIYEKRPVLGVIFNPFLDQLWTGIRGRGSFLTTRGGTPQKLPLGSAKPLPALSQALVVCDWGNDRSITPLTSRTKSFSKLALECPEGQMVHSIRSTGSSALNYAWISQGALDIYWEVGCYPWDVCAGIVIAEEAGALVTGPHQVFEATHNGPSFGEVTESILTGRKYIVVRGIAEENSKEQQKRIIKEFYDTVEDYTVKGLSQM